jgi:flagellar biosynthesis/type III secretory pathway protein FliH
MNKKRIARENLNAWFLQNAFKRGYQKGYRAGVKGTIKKYYKNLTECAELETRMKKAFGDPKIWRERW